MLIAVFGPMVIDGIDFDFMNSAGAVRTSLISPNPGSSGGSGSIPLPEGFEWLEGLEGLDNLPYITTIGVRVIGVVLIVLGVLLILVNIFYTRNLHKFTKSLCTSLKSDTYDIRKAKTSHAWMIVSAVFTILAFAGSAALAKDVFDVMSVAKELCSIITIILSAVMIKKHFIND